MSKKTILKANQKKMTLDGTPLLDEAIFRLLRNMYNKNNDSVITQVKIAEELGSSQPTISNHLNDLIGREYDYGTYYYKIVKAKSGYKILRQKKSSVCDPKRPTPIEHRTEEAKLRGECAVEIQNSKCLVNNGVVEVSEQMIFYKIKRDKNKKTIIDFVINTLRSGFPQHYFYDIAYNDKGIYIILNSESLGRDLTSAKKAICDYYNDMVRQIKLYGKL